MTTTKSLTFDLTKGRMGQKGSARAFLSKLSKGLMLPVALLPIAGLLMGGGAGLQNILDSCGLSIESNPGAYALPILFKMMGDIIFGALPLLFAVAIAISFTEDAGIAGFSSVVGWLAFNVIQSVFITPNVGGETYHILYWQEVPKSVVGTNIGIESMVTSVFGGMAIGFLTAAVYNKFHKVQLPKSIGFFGGTRSVPIITFFAASSMGMLFLMIWPWFGIKLDQFGALLSGMPASTDAFIFGVIERALIPFGLHHAFGTPISWTSVGGTLYVFDGATSSYVAKYFGNQGTWFGFVAEGISFKALDSATTVSLASGDVAGMTAGTYDMITWDVNGNGTIDGASETFYMTEGLDPGTYMQGKFPIMIFCLPAAAIAMIMAADKENRQVASAILISAAFTSFLTGITEPIEFTFLFIAPFLYYGFHIWMAGFSFWSLALLGANVNSTFSGGMIDLAVYGFLMDATGFATQSYYVLVVGAVMAPIYYFFFYWYIKKFNIPTPGRDGAEVKLTTRADYQASKDGAKVGKGNRDSRVNTLIDNLGGLNNLETVDACITRLRLTVKDRSKVKDAELKKMGAAGIVGSNKAIQVIFGAEADIFRSEIKEQQRLQQFK